MISRRRFLSQGSLAALGLATTTEGWFAGRATAATGETIVTFLHTNDVHSRIDPFPETNRRNAGRAGAVGRARLIDTIRAEAQATGQPRPLLLDAGDVFQGTPYFNLYKGELDFKVMAMLGYDAMTIGNHDYDIGLSGLADADEAAGKQFEMLSANYDFSRAADPRLKKRVKSAMIRAVGPVRVGIFGLGVTLQGLVPDVLWPGVRYLDPLEIARREASHLRFAEKCDLVVCLSHLGVDGYRGEPGDQQIAREVAEIDLIIGGHSHTFMSQPRAFSHGAGERTTRVFQVGFAGINLGRVDFRMQDGRIIEVTAASIPVGDA